MGARQSLRRRRIAAVAVAACAAALAAQPAMAGNPHDDSGHGGHGGRGFAEHSVRADLTDQNFYFVMGDRFANGDTSNDRGGLTGDRNVTGFDPTSKAFFNGGDLAGLQSKLDYIKGLGTKAIWLTPIFKNKAVQLEDGPSAGYHGYWITDFTQVDPHLGTNAELSSLIKAAHGKGMKVFFDIITNHTADVIGYQEGARTAYVSKDTSPYRTAGGKVFDDRDYAEKPGFPTLSPATSFPYHPVLDDTEKNLKVPAWLNDVTLYHNRGNTTFTGEDSQYGDFFGLDDLFTENPKVEKGFEQIYSRWVKDFGVDGFRIDTMKHVNDEFWQKFGPGLVDYAHANGKRDFFMFGEVALDGSGPASKSFTSHYTTHNGMQAILDFPFQDAARGFASKSGSAATLGEFFDNDDWYTDADSNAYQLPTFLGNHDMGRFGYFLKTDNPGASDAQLLQRDKLGHQLMYFSRGNPVVYYGDEQGFAGGGGDQLARQDMFASQVPEYRADDQIGTDRTAAQDNFVTSHPLYREIADLAKVTKQNPALRNGASQVRYASSGPGVFAVSRTDAKQQREYVVAFNNASEAKTAKVPTYVADRRFSRVYGEGPARLTTDRDRRLTVTVPALSTVVYALDGTIPRSKAAPSIRLTGAEPSSVSRGRTAVTASVSGNSFNEVTFQAKVGDGRWTDIGTDDNAPYRVFHDTSDLKPGTKVLYRAAVLDNAGHVASTGATPTRVASPTLKVTTPTSGSEVTRIDPVTVTAEPDPERPDMSVTFQRKVGNGSWSTIGTDSSSPAYTVKDDVSDLAIGTSVSYRAILHEPGSPSVTSSVSTVTVSDPKPARDHVTVAGDLQSEMGCEADWNPACTQSRLSFDTGDGKWHGTFSLPAGDYSWKIAIDDSWTENYGAGGAAGGDNLSLAVPTGGGEYTFTWDQVSHVPSVAPAG